MNAVDFNNPEAIDAAIEQAEAVKETTPKEKKPAKPRVIKVTYVADKDYAAGDTIEFDFEVPKGTSRGQLTGIALEDMTDDQLKIEYRNSSSVAYKTKKAGRDTTKADERVARCVAEMDKRGIQPTARASAATDVSAVAEAIKSGKINIEELQALINA